MGQILLSGNHTVLDTHSLFKILKLYPGTNINIIMCQYFTLISNMLMEINNNAKF